MMRQIKFRVWDKVEKEMMLPARWEEDYVGCNHKKIGLYIYRSKKDPRQHSSLSWILKHPEHFDLMQFTGLKDKYEGDLLLKKSKYYEDEIWEVFWNDEEARFDVKDKNGHPYSFRLVCDDPETNGWWQDLPIIGNIYDNPELLK